MTHKLKFIPAFFFLVICMTSCGKKEMEEILTERISAVEEAVGTDLLFAETFESRVPLYTAHSTDFGAPHSFNVVTNPVFSGAKSARFELRDTDPMISSGTRAEVTIVKDSVRKEMWYSFAAFFPADGFAADSESELISQWHQSPDKHLGEKSQSPATQLLIKNDRFILDTGFNKAKVSAGVRQDSRKKIDLGLVDKDSWHQFVFHFIHSYHADGLLEVWHNGKKLVSLAGGNMYNNVVMPKWKLGIYKWEWNGRKTTDTHKRVLYFDNIKVGDHQVSLSDMVPAKNPKTPKDPTPYPVTALTLVNSHIDRDVRRFVTGDNLVYKNLETKKFNVRATTNAAKTGCVKFVLSGPKNFEYADKQKPYTLFGDNGAGNYFYWKSLPPGTYNLQVTPYSDTKAKGVPGETYSMTFIVSD